MTLQVGTSGWQYADWRGALYAPGVPQRRWLAAYAERYHGGIQRGVLPAARPGNVRVRNALSFRTLCESRAGRGA